MNKIEKMLYFFQPATGKLLRAKFILELDEKF